MKPEIAQALDLPRGAAPGSSRWRRRVALAVAATVLVVGGASLMLAARAPAAADAAQRYVTAAVERGDLAVVVSANGTLHPTRTVSIGSELSGVVARVLVDVNDRVRRGQVLIELDTAKLRDQVARARANVDSATAKSMQAQAALQEASATLTRQEEVHRLSGGRVPSANELETRRTAVLKAQADVASARASITEAAAALSTEETNLAKASIRSPIDGVVLARSVEPGNAVAASLQAVTLLTLGEDLSRLKLQVNVDEADVTAIRTDQAVRFTVSAHANREFEAVLTRVAFGSTISDNVVTYTTTLTVDNADGSLRPGMTANARFAAAERRNALLVPNTALRFSPASAPVAEAGQGGFAARFIPKPPGVGPTTRAPGAESTGASRRVWVLREGVPQPVPVVTGVSDGKRTEIVSGELSTGDVVITDQRADKT